MSMFPLSTDQLYRITHLILFSSSSSSSAYYFCFSSVYFLRGQSSYVRPRVILTTIRWHSALFFFYTNYWCNRAK